MTEEREMKRVVAWAVWSEPEGAGADGVLAVVLVVEEEGAGAGALTVVLVVEEGEGEGEGEGEVEGEGEGVDEGEGADEEGEGEGADTGGVTVVGAPKISLGRRTASIAWMAMGKVVAFTVLLVTTLAELRFP